MKNWMEILVVMYAISRDLEYALLRLFAVNECVASVRERMLTRQGLFSSKPGGASTLSVCPRRYPVNLLSRSITANRVS